VAQASRPPLYSTLTEDLMVAPSVIDNGGAGGGGGAGTPAAINWSFPGTLSTDQNGNIPRWIERVGRTLAFFDVNLISAPTGDDLVVEFIVNGAMVASVTVPAGDTYAEVAAAVTLAINDVIYPQITQVGSLTPGTTALFRARVV